MSGPGVVFATSGAKLEVAMADELDEIRTGEEANYQISLKLLGDSVSLVQDLLDLYKLMAEIASKSRLAVRNEFFTGLHFLAASRYHLTIGALAALRTHISDAQRSGRMAIELAAFAALVKRQPALAMVWLNAGQDEASYKRYRRTFSSQNLFPDDDPLLKSLGDRFDTTSKLSHPSIYSLAEHTRITRTDSAMNLEFHYFTVKKDNAREPTLTYFWTLDTHFGVLRVFEQVLKEVLEGDRGHWEIRRNGVDAKLGVHKQRWKNVILSQESRQGPSSTGLIIIPPF